MRQKARDRMKNQQKCYHCIQNHVSPNHVLENKLVLVELPDITGIFEQNGNFVDNKENLVACNQYQGSGQLVVECQVPEKLLYSEIAAEDAYSAVWISSAGTAQPNANNQYEHC